MVTDSLPHRNESSSGRAVRTHRAARPRIRLTWIIPFALAIRLVHVAFARDLPFLEHPVGDAAGYLAWAKEIALGQWIGTEPFYQAPLYPYLLAILVGAFGAATITVVLAQCVLGSLAAWALAIATARTSGRSAGWVAGLLYALYAPAVFFDGIIQKASLAGSLTCFFLLLLQGGRPRSSSGRLLAAGAVTGLLVLTRENALVWLALIGAWLAVRAWRLCGKRKSAEGFVAYLAGAALVLGPVALRNAMVGGHISLSTFQMGPNFYIGNGAGATGRYRPLVRGHETPEFERADATRLAEEALGRSLNAKEVSRYWLDLALSDMKSAPLGWLKLMGAKILMTLNACEVGDVESYSVYREYSPVLQGLGSAWHFGMLLPLGGAGIVLGGLRRRGERLRLMMLLSMLLAIALFFVLARYRFPLAVLLIPFAAVAGIRLWRAARGRRVRRVGAALAAAAVLAFISNGLQVHPQRQLEAMAWSNLGVCYAQTGNLDAAVGCLESAARDHPSAESFYNLGMVLSQLERWEEALDRFEQALKLENRLIEADYRCGVALEALGRPAAAEVHYRRALDVDPTDERAQTGLRRVQREKSPGSLNRP